MKNTDINYMNLALFLAKNSVGSVHPNPSVGCVIVKDSVILATGVTANGGRPHGEVVALSKINYKANGATAFVTLEPCFHYGETKPCCDALIKSGIKRVVVSMLDPDKRVNGKGIEKLRQAGIVVDIGLGSKKAKEINRGFITRIIKKRPFITLKIATSLDGKIALNSGASQWITGEKSRKFVHLLRSLNDGVMVGAGTFIKDNPSLNCRIDGINKKLLPIIVAGNRKLNIENSNIIKNHKKILILSNNENYKNAINLNKINEVNGKIDLKQAMKKLAKYGLNNILVEGGGNLATELLLNGLVDEIVWFMAPRIIGNDGIEVIKDLNLQTILEELPYKVISSKKIENDIIINLIVK